MSVDLLVRYGPNLLHGLVVTLEIIVLSVGIGFLIALPVAFGRLSNNRVVRGLAGGYTLLFRGTPLIAQVFLAYYGFGQFRPALQAVGLWWFFREAFWCVIFTFTLNTAAYQAEIFRGAIEAVPRGQSEAGAALGLHRRAIFRTIVGPQAAMIALRPFGNELILMIKGSAIASVVTVYDLLGEARLAFSRTFDFSIYFYAAILYLILIEAIRRVWEALDRRLTRHLAARAPATGPVLGEPAGAVD